MHKLVGGDVHGNAMQIGTEAISLTLKAAPPAAGWLIVFSVNLHLITQKAVLTGG